MAVNKREIVYLHGVVYWAKVLGKPRLNYQGDGKEWSFEFEPDPEGVKELKTRGLADRLRTKDTEGYEDRGKYLILRRRELTADGEENAPIRVVDAANLPWDDNNLLGNRTEVDLKVQIVDYGKGMKTGIYPEAIRVLNLVPYESKDFAPLPEDDERVIRAKRARPAATTDDFKKDFGLED